MIGVASSQNGPIISIPMGNPPSPCPTGATVAGHPVRVATAIHRIKSSYLRGPAEVVTVRLLAGLLWSCGNVAVNATGERKTSTSSKYFCHCSRKPNCLKFWPSHSAKLRRPGGVSPDDAACPRNDCRRTRFPHRRGS